MRQYSWTILVVAGVFETEFSVGLKYSERFTRLWPSVATAIMIVLSLGLVGYGLPFLKGVLPTPIFDLIVERVLGVYSKHDHIHRTANF
jgi:hypothetical protein